MMKEDRAKTGQSNLLYVVTFTFFRFFSWVFSWRKNPMIEKKKRDMGTVSIIEDCQLNEIRIYQGSDGGNKDTQHYTSFEGYLEGAVCSIEIEGGVL